MKAREALLDLVFPPHCAFCGAVDARGVCPDCERALPRTRQPLRPIAAGVDCAAPLRYEGTVREALLRFKFQGRRGAARGLGGLLAQCAAEELGGRFDCVCWAPVSRARMKQRGYDQAYLLASAAARLWDTKPLRLLEKHRDNPAQSGMDASARRANVRGVYAVLQSERVRGARILLVDDIVTTGSTLAECVRTLKTAGAQSVVCACVAAAEERR